MNGNDVVVGFDGTASGGAALRWAAGEAERTGARLRVVVGYDPMHVAERLRAGAQAATVAAEARAERPGLDVTAAAMAGDPAEILAALAADVATVVVGSHGHTALSAALGRGIGTRVAMRAHGRIAVVRGRADAADGPVVVGVDGSPTDNRLLAAAFEHATRCGCEVVAIRAWRPPIPPWGVGIPPLTGAAAPDPATLLAELSDDVQRWHEKYPAVPATARVPSGDPAGVLLDASGEARLLVVGGRPHSPFAALLADSISQRLLYHAACPLLIVHNGSRA